MTKHMMKTTRIAFLLAIIILIFCDSAIWARGGAGFRGGGFRGGDDFGRDFGNRDESYYGGAGRGDYDRAHSDLDNAALLPHESSTRDYAAERPIASDGAFGRLATGDAYAGHMTNRVNPAEMDSRADAVRAGYGYGYGGVYDHGFWGAHPEAGWAYANRWGDDWAWGYSGLPALAGWWGMSGAAMPVAYDYGNNITYQNGSVYYGSQPMESAVAYYGQAQNLAQSIPVTAAETKSKSDWKTLGVFSMVQGEQTNTTSMFQLAVNKKGAIKGSYYNPLTNETKPVKGAVDKKNMRASWIVGEDKNVVYDSGLNNLLQKQSQLLVHCGKDKTQQWTLVRLEKPKTG